MAPKAITWLDLANRALSRLGAELIEDFKQGTPNANLVGLHYAEVVRELLSEADWTFARKRLELAATADVPVFGFSFRYPLPDDWIRFSEGRDERGANAPLVDTRGYPWRLEGQAIVTDAPTVTIVYVAEVGLANVLTMPFRRAYIAALAATLGTSITKSEALRGVLLVEARTALDDARAENAMNAPEEDPEAQDEGSILRARD